MTASVYHDSGSLDFQLWDGQLFPMVSIGDFYQRPGRNGEGSQALSGLGPDSEIVANYLATSVSIARQAQVVAAAWQTKFLRITDPTSKVYTNVLAKVVQTRVLRGKYAHNGTTYTYRCEARLTLSLQS